MIFTIFLSFPGGAPRRPENPEEGDRIRWVLGSRFARPRMTCERWSGSQP